MACQLAHTEVLKFLNDTFVGRLLRSRIVNRKFRKASEVVQEFQNLGVEVEVFECWIKCSVQANRESFIVGFLGNASKGNRPFLDLSGHKASVSPSVLYSLE